MQHRHRLTVGHCAVLFLILGAALLGSLLASRVRARNAGFRSLCAVARAAYDSGGSERLSEIAGALSQATGLRPYLLDPWGRDLTGGPARPDLLDSSLPPAGPYSCAVVGDSGMDEGFPVYCVLAAGWSLGALSAGWFALRLRRLDLALSRFGAGELGLRLHSGFADPLSRLASTFNQMAVRIETLLSSHRRLCLDLSHELRSPLTRLRLAVAVARTGSAGAFDQIEAEAARIADLVDGLLDVTGAEVNPENVHWETLDLTWLVEEISAFCALEAARVPCRINLNSLAAGTLNGDAELLRRAVENVLRNAIAHSPAGSVIDVVVSGDASAQCISIRDHGPGAPAEALDRLFQPFYRGSAGGAGLGLAIAHRAIALHNGSIRAHNANPGLQVEIRLPCHLPPG